MIRPPRLLPLVAALVLLAACSGGKTTWHAHDITGVMPDLAYHLSTGENGKPVQAGAYAGKIRLVYFGYSHCPKLCPLTMAHLHAAIDRLPKADRDRVRVLFISVDPKRDSAQRLAKWTDNFGPRFIGMTGSQQQLRSISKHYRITYSYNKPNKNGFYTVNHSSAVFVFGPQGKARLLINQSQDPKDIAADLQQLLAQTTG